MAKQLFLNGNVKVACAKLTYKDTAAAKLFSLPKTAHLLEIYVVVKTAFNDSGTDVLDIGVATDTDKFVNDLDVSSAGVLETTLLAYGPLAGAGPQIEVVGQFIGQNGNATAGEAYVYAVYTSPFLS